MFDQQAARLRTVATGVPTQRRTAECRSQDLNRARHVLALDCLIDLLIADPAQSVAGNFMSQLFECADCFGMTRNCHRNREDRERQLMAFEYPQHAPQTCPRTILIQRFHAHVTHRKSLRPDDLGQKHLRGRITVQNAALPTLFEIQYELQRDTCAAGPLRMRRVSPVAGQIARVLLVLSGHRLVLPVTNPHQ